MSDVTDNQAAVVYVDAPPPPPPKSAWMSPERPFWFPDAQGFMMIAVVGMAATVLFYRMSNPGNNDDKLLDTMVTILFGTAFVAIINWLYGSSRGSMNKDDAITKIAVAATPAAPPKPPAPTQNGTGG